MQDSGAPNPNQALADPAGVRGAKPVVVSLQEYGVRSLSAQLNPGLQRAGGGTAQTVAQGLWLYG